MEINSKIPFTIKIKDYKKNILQFNGERKIIQVKGKISQRKLNAIIKELEQSYPEYNNKSLKL